MVTLHKGFTLAVLLFFIFTLTMVMCGTVPIKKRSLLSMEGDGSRDAIDQKSRPSKRTFCNNFHGCGGKRSDPGMRDYEDGRDSPRGDSLDENFMDEVARDILADARLWEAYQARNYMINPMKFRRQNMYRREKRATHNLEKPSTREEIDVNMAVEQKSVE